MRRKGCSKVGVLKDIEAGFKMEVAWAMEFARR
jgi:hypothetical protein